MLVQRTDLGSIRLSVSDASPKNRHGQFPNVWFHRALRLDILSFWVTCCDFRLQVVAATAMLYMCVKMHDRPPELIGVDGQLLALVHGATLFLERAMNDNEPGLDEFFFFS